MGNPERWYEPRPDPEGLTPHERAYRRRVRGQLAPEDGPGPALYAAAAALVTVGCVVLYFAVPMMVAMMLPGG